jgi:ethanolamine utilization cobalamin adenosyltransferase
MSAFKTPVLTENMILQADNNLSEIIIPEGTVITPGAKDLINKRRIRTIYKQTE